jgi:NAD(P)-dependent dehydrogenase (short-subunit alcohol dehydrogenase family)
MMNSLGQDYTAVVIGASGGIGAGFVRALSQDAACAQVLAFSRSGAVEPARGVVAGHIDVEDEASIAAAAQTVAGSAPRLVLVATGYLHDRAQEGGAGPEKSWSQMTPDSLARNFSINATGPALVAKHFLPLMPRGERAILAALSARVGSISDNRVGGWYGYRASKAALNQILKCLAIEGGRTRRGLVVAGLQPGTVRTALSAPFRSAVEPDDLFTPDASAANLLRVLDGLEPAQSGRMFDWSGAEVLP